MLRLPDEPATVAPLVALNANAATSPPALHPDGGGGANEDCGAAAGTRRTASAPALPFASLVST